MLTDTANFRNENYHTPGDSLGTLNFEFMKNAVKAVLATAAQLAVPISAGYAEADLSSWLGVGEYDNPFETAVFIAPNPSNGLLSLWIENSKEAFEAYVEVYDIVGKCLYKNDLDFPLGKSSSEIDLHALANGSYILVLKSKTASKSIGFIISE